MNLTTYFMQRGCKYMKETREKLLINNILQLVFLDNIIEEIKGKDGIVLRFGGLFFVFVDRSLRRLLHGKVHCMQRYRITRRVNTGRSRHITDIYLTGGQHVPVGIACFPLSNNIGVGHPRILSNSAACIQQAYEEEYYVRYPALHRFLREKNQYIILLTLKITK